MCQRKYLNAFTKEPLLSRYRAWMFDVPSTMWTVTLSKMCYGFFDGTNMYRTVLYSDLIMTWKMWFCGYYPPSAYHWYNCQLFKRISFEPFSAHDDKLGLNINERLIFDTLFALSSMVTIILHAIRIDNLITLMLGQNDKNKVSGPPFKLISSEFIWIVRNGSDWVTSNRVLKS